MSKEAEMEGKRNAVNEGESKTDGRKVVQGRVSKKKKKESSFPRCSLKVEGTQTELVAACSPSAENQTLRQRKWEANRKEE